MLPPRVKILRSLYELVLKIPTMITFKALKYVVLYPQIGDLINQNKYNTEE